MAGKSVLTTPGGEPEPWFARNWKWAVPLGCLGVIVLCAAFVGGLLLIVETSFKNSDAYHEALARARSNQQVAEKIGRPFHPGWFVSGHINVSGSSGHADLSIPMVGPKGKGTLYVVSEKSAGRWKFETLQVAVEGEAERIDLLAEPRTPVEQ
jgi:hypothetical protein